MATVFDTIGADQNHLRGRLPENGLCRRNFKWCATNSAQCVCDARLWLCATATRQLTPDQNPYAQPARLGRSPHAPTHGNWYGCVL